MANCCTLDILNSSCTLLLRRDWGERPPQDYLLQFSTAIKEAGELHLAPTFALQSGEHAFFHVRHRDLIFLCTCQTDANPALIFKFIHSLVELLRHYFGQLEEESIRDNFVLIYELLDETMDYGFPQFTEGHVLQQFITLDAQRLDLAQAPPTVTSALSWRSEGVCYAKNEIFLDLTEKCSLNVNSFGEVTRSSLQGAVQMKCQLSGMPECTLGLNAAFSPQYSGREGFDSSSSMEDVKFHHCVKLHEFATDRNIAFVPPDGLSELMTYRMSSGVPPLVWVEAKRSLIGGTKVKYSVKLSTLFKDRFAAQHINLLIPVESDATKPEIQCKLGEVVYKPELESISWRLKNITGGKNVELVLLLSVPTVKSDSSRASHKHVEVDFNIPYYTPSGTQVRYLKVAEKSGYSALPWVRYITCATDYTFKIIER